jgi:hypothetical protein
MAGVKGKSGGARANAGGKRAGAGRKPKEAAPESANGDAHSVSIEMEPQPHGGALKRSKAETQEIAERDMLTLLQDIALGRVEASNNQVRAAIAAVQYTHRKKGEGGKKEEDAARATAAGAGKFGVRQAPRLAVSNK